MTTPAAPALPCPCPGLDLLHVDDHCVVLNKPSGLHTVPGLGADKQDSLLGRLQTHDPDIWAVHRLDRDTSGILVFGRHREAIGQLGRQFQARTVDKRYVALVAGSPREDAGEIHLAMRYAPEIKPRQVVDPVHGKPAHTHWQVLTRHANSTLMALMPVTGRTHQLRVHMQAIGHAIVGDLLYASPELQAAAPRLCLHAAELAFDHPATGERLRFSVPEDFSAFAF